MRKVHLISSLLVSAVNQSHSAVLPYMLPYMLPHCSKLSCTDSDYFQTSDRLIVDLICHSVSFMPAITPQKQDVMPEI